MTCANCGSGIYYDLKHQRGGRCPRCGYKLGDHDKAHRLREPRYLVELEKAMRTCGFEDEKLIKQTKRQAQVKHDLLERESKRRFTEWLSNRAPMPRMGRIGETKYPCFGCLWRLRVPEQEVKRRLKIGSSVYTSWSYRMLQSNPNERKHEETKAESTDEIERISARAGLQKANGLAWLR
jgi:hypothetical protein